MNSTASYNPIVQEWHRQLAPNVPIRQLVEYLNPALLGLENKAQFYAPIQFAIHVAGPISGPAGALRLAVPVHKNPEWLPVLKARIGKLVGAPLGATIDLVTLGNKSIASFPEDQLHRIGKLNVMVDGKRVRLASLPAVPVEYATNKVASISSWYNEVKHGLPELLANEFMHKSAAQLDKALAPNGTVKALIAKHIADTTTDWTEFVRVHHMNSPYEIHPAGAQKVLDTVASGILTTVRDFVKAAAPSISSYLASIESERMARELAATGADYQPIFGNTNVEASAEDGYELYFGLASSVFALPSVERTVSNTIYIKPIERCRWTDADFDGRGPGAEDKTVESLRGAGGARKDGEKHTAVAPLGSTKKPRTGGSGISGTKEKPATAALPKTTPQPLPMAPEKVALESFEKTFAVIDTKEKQDIVDFIYTVWRDYMMMRKQKKSTFSIKDVSDLLQGLLQKPYSDHITMIKRQVLTFYSDQQKTSDILSSILQYYGAALATDDPEVFTQTLQTRLNVIISKKNLRNLYFDESKQGPWLPGKWNEIQPTAEVGFLDFFPVIFNPQLFEYVSEEIFRNSRMQDDLTRNQLRVLEYIDKYLQIWPQKGSIIGHELHAKELAQLIVKASPETDNAYTFVKNVCLVSFGVAVSDEVKSAKQFEFVLLIILHNAIMYKDPAKAADLTKRRALYKKKTPQAPTKPAVIPPVVDKDKGPADAAYNSETDSEYVSETSDDKYQPSDDEDNGGSGSAMEEQDILEEPNYESAVDSETGKAPKDFNTWLNSITPVTPAEFDIIRQTDAFKFLQRKTSGLSADKRRDLFAGPAADDLEALKTAKYRFKLPNSKEVKGTLLKEIYIPLLESMFPENSAVAIGFLGNSNTAKGIFAKIVTQRLGLTWGAHPLKSAIESHHPWNAQIHHTLKELAGGVYPEYYNMLHTRQDMTENAPYKGNLEDTYKAYHLFSNVHSLPIACPASKKEKKKKTKKTKALIQGALPKLIPLTPIACGQSKKKDDEGDVEMSAPIRGAIPKLIPLEQNLPKLIPIQGQAPKVIPIACGHSDKKKDGNDDEDMSAPIQGAMPKLIPIQGQAPKVIPIACGHSEKKKKKNKDDEDMNAPIRGAMPRFIPIDEKVIPPRPPLIRADLAKKMRDRLVRVTEEVPSEGHGFAGLPELDDLFD
jgi:hypothetical protein